MTAALAALLVTQMSPAQVREIRAYRYGRSAAQIEAMGFAPYERLFRSKNPPSGATRGVANAVFVDAYRENTARRYRDRLPAATRNRLVELDRQIRFLGVLFARNDWAFSPGNAFDPESDALEYAQAERQLYVTSLKPNEARMRRLLETYRTFIVKEGRQERVKGLGTNLRKIDTAIVKAKALCRTPRERAVLFEFVANRAKARL